MSAQKLTREEALREIDSLYASDQLRQHFD
jgi:hypothetical protein